MAIISKIPFLSRFINYLCSHNNFNNHFQLIEVTHGSRVETPTPTAAVDSEQVSSKRGHEGGR
jgi:hypothetical protein